MELPFRTTTFTFGFEESFNLNEENLNRHQELHGEFQKGFYMSSKMFVSWEIPTGYEVSRFGELTYTPLISATFNHEFPNWPLQSIRRGPFLDFNHLFGFERINWHANYREGLSVSLSNSYNYDFFRFQNDEDPLSISFTFNGTGHFLITRFLGISSRLQYRHWFYHEPGYYDLAGDAIRGILNKALSANYMLSLNFDFPFRLPMFAPSRWFNNERLRAFDIEFHLSPIIDMALYNDPRTETSFNLNNIVSGCGIEFIIFPVAMRSLYIRMSFAWNLREISINPFGLPGGENREISFMMGHFF